MRRNLLLFASALVMFWSCDQVLTTDVNTNLTQEINVDAQESGLKSADLTVPFDVTDTLNFADNKDLQQYLSNIQDLNFESAGITLTDIPEGIIVNVTVSLPNYDISQSFEGLENGSVVALSAANATKLNNSASKIKDAEKIVINVKGDASTATKFKLLIDFAVKVKAGL